MSDLGRAVVAAWLVATACSSPEDEGQVGVDAGGQSIDARTGGGALDPAPGREVPGEYGCPGCPDVDTSVFTRDVGAETSTRFDGVVSNASGNGTFYVRGPAGEETAGPIPTLPDGTFSFEAPLFCGEQLVKCVWDNAAGSYALVISVVTRDCVAADIRVTLSWDQAGQDLEVHLIKPGGRINDPATDCTWNTCQSTSPDWGVVGDATDNPKKDVDNTGSFGPENIFLVRPEPGVYTVLVEHWGAGAPSDAEVILNVGGVATVARIQDLVSHHVWTAATIQWPEKTVTPATTIFDCTANWSGGCLSPLP